MTTSQLKAHTNTDMRVVGDINTPRIALVNLFPTPERKNAFQQSIFLGGLCTRLACCLGRVITGDRGRTTRILRVVYSHC